MSEEVVDAWARVRSALMSLFNALNAFGAIVLTYALQNQTLVVPMLRCSAVCGGVSCSGRR
jgi:hypothetical protein